MEKPGTEQDNDQWKSEYRTPKSIPKPVKIFKDDAKVEVSFKDEKGTTRLWTLLVKTAKYEAGMWKYQLKSKDGTTFADGEWFAEEKLDFAKD